ncbi:PAS domain-containing sensor histidine kinase [Caldimonas tepidiphila]|uniref:PAS domain-containing sensor histidine kinase n=1 Tax=Caldimonas tepidiphila TaxID=2315841 RepID=UPI000E5AB2A8|nr:PAS domain-containing sensor histidine kinase [Caldimonas tepidiphila]
MLSRGTERPARACVLSPLNIALIYVVVSALWIAGADHLLQTYTAGPRLLQLHLLESGVFVMLSGLLLYLLVGRLHRSLRLSARKARESEAGARRSADELAQLLAMLPEAVLIVREGRITYANRAAQELFDPDGTQVLEGHPLNGLVLPPYWSGVEQRMQRVLASGERDPRFLPRTMCRLDGSRFEASVGTSAVHFDDRPAVLKIVRDVDEMNRMQRQVTRVQQELAALSGRLIELQEHERRSIARELHDEIGQCLSAIRVQFAKLQRRVQGEEPLALIASAAAMTERTLSRVRSLSLLLHPPQLGTLGLEAALRWHIEEQQRLHGTPISLRVALGREPLDPDLGIACYRIVQESLSNALRHADARCIEVELRGASADGLVLRITDDGIGFAAEQAGARQAERPSLGLVGMMERARLQGGELTVSSAPGQGTRVEAVLPWKSETKIQ